MFELLDLRRWAARQGKMRPSRRAETTACMRLVTLSLTMLCFRWKLTVCSETLRILPIVQALLPLAVQVRHSRSRSEMQIADGSHVCKRLVREYANKNCTARKC